MLLSVYNKLPFSVVPRCFVSYRKKYEAREVANGTSQFLFERLNIDDGNSWKAPFSLKIIIMCCYEQYNKPVQVRIKYKMATSEMVSLNIHIWVNVIIVDILENDLGLYAYDESVWPWLIGKG